MKEFFGEDHLCTGISLMKRNRKARNSDTEKLRKKVVIYRGENTTLENGIEYGSVKEYLKSLV